MPNTASAADPPSAATRCGEPNPAGIPARFLPPGHLDAEAAAASSSTTVGAHQRYHCRRCHHRRRHRCHERHATTSATTVGRAATASLTATTVAASGNRRFRRRLNRRSRRPRRPRFIPGTGLVPCPQRYGCRRRPRGLPPGAAGRGPSVNRGCGPLSRALPRLPRRVGRWNSLLGRCGVWPGCSAGQGRRGCVSKCAGPGFPPREAGRVRRPARPVVVRLRGVFSVGPHVGRTRPTPADP